jgi:hypothetical protein
VRHERVGWSFLLDSRLPERHGALEGRRNGWSDFSVSFFSDVRFLRQSGIEIAKPMLGFRIVIAVTANGQQSKPSRLDGAPSGLPPKLRLALAGRPTFQVPKRSLLLSIANNRLSKRILVRAPRSGFLLELMVAAWSLLLREQARSSSLLV